MFGGLRLLVTIVMHRYLFRRSCWLSWHKSTLCFFSSRRRHTRCLSDWSSDVCSSDLAAATGVGVSQAAARAAQSSVAISKEGSYMTDATPTAAAPLTVVLVHGAFADASSWAGVIPLLQAADVNVLAPANPLRGINHDAAYTASVVSQIPGPVLLVAHSYGGAVITNAGTRADNVRGLVYVCAFIPDEGETLQALASQSTDSQVLPALRPTHYPMDPSSAPGTEFAIDPALFHAVF